MNRLRSLPLRLLLEGLCWLVLAFGIYFAKPALLGSAISQGAEGTATVPLFNLWTIEWNVESLEKRYSNYWNAPIFAPQRGAFAFSEPQPLTALLAPVVWWLGSAAAYNVLFLGYLALNALTTRVLLVDLHIPRLWACVGGLLILILPFLSWQSGVLQLLALWGPISVIWAFRRLEQCPSWSRAVLLAALFAVAYCACNYYALFLSLLAPAFLVLAGRKLASRRFWLMLTTAAVLSGMLLCPLVWGQLKNLHLIDADRSLDSIERLSAYPSDYCINRETRLKPLDTSHWGHPQRSGWYLGCGSVPCVLALGGLLSGLSMTGRRRWTLFCLIFGLLAGFLSCGTLLKWGDFRPYSWLHQWYPGLNAIRSPFRFAVFAQWSIMALAVEGLWAMERFGRWIFVPPPPAENDDLVELPRTTPHWHYVAGHSLSVAFPICAAVLAVIQIWPSRLELTTVGQRTPGAAWIQWLKSNTAPEDQLICLPFPNGSSAAEYMSSVAWMRLGLDHGRPLGNGYSGFFPPQFLELRAELSTARLENESDWDYRWRMQSYPQEATAHRLRDLQFKYLVIHDSVMPPEALAGLERFPLLMHDAEKAISIRSLNNEQIRLHWQN